MTFSAPTLVTSCFVGRCFVAGFLNQIRKLCEFGLRLITRLSSEAPVRLGLAMTKSGGGSKGPAPIIPDNLAETLEATYVQQERDVVIVPAVTVVAVCLECLIVYFSVFLIVCVCVIVCLCVCCLFVVVTVVLA